MREFGLGAALGWGMVAVVLLVVALVGHFYVQLWTAPRAWGLLVVQILTVLAGALAGEIAFRGYPFQKLVETVGPFSATILAAIIFGALRVTTPGSTPTAVWISGVAAILLSAAYLRTHALWLSWGLALCMDREHRDPVRPTAGGQPAGFERHPHLRGWTDLADWRRVWAGRQHGRFDRVVGGALCSDPDDAGPGMEIWPAGDPSRRAFPWT